jgi:hypothetical protein
MIAGKRQSVVIRLGSVMKGESPDFFVMDAQDVLLEQVRVMLDHIDQGGISSQESSLKSTMPQRKGLTVVHLGRVKLRPGRVCGIDGNEFALALFQHDGNGLSVVGLPWLRVSQGLNVLTHAPGLSPQGGGQLVAALHVIPSSHPRDADEMTFPIQPLVSNSRREMA